MGRTCIKIVFYLFLGILTFPATGQEVIPLRNASFEGSITGGMSQPPLHWFDCGFPGESPPDTQPGAFEVSKPAIHGGTYLGLVVRDVDTYERVGQALSSPMLAGTCYTFSLYLARSDEYFSQSRKEGRLVYYTTPVKLLIYGGNGYCDRRQLLAESEPVANTKWLKYTFTLSPERDYSHILLEANYNTPVLFPYNGNITIDNASNLVPIACEEDELQDEPIVVQVEEPVQSPLPIPKKETPTIEKPIQEVEKPKEEPKVVTIVTKEEPMDSEATSNNVSIMDLDSDEGKRSLKPGSIINLDNLYFKASKYTISDESVPTLEKVYEFLKKSPNFIVEIGGHTNNLPPTLECDRLSTRRAKEVADHLIELGIPKRQIFYRGYGKRRPIASNETLEGRQKNQRVEIKILSTQG